MKKESRIILKYSQEGHYMYPEDTWDASFIISTEKELFKAIKELHKQSASNFNDYPFNHLFSFSNISFKIQSFIIDENGELYYGQEKECDPPIYYENAKASYKEWISAIKERLPKLRKARDNRLKEEQELMLLKTLSSKYP
jgi:hypothetical protein